MVTVNSAVLRRGQERSRQVRQAAAALRYELAHGVTRPAEAMLDARAGVLTAYGLAISVRGVGPEAARQVCERLRIPETKRVRDLTDRQKERLGALLEVCGR